jgi:integrase
MKGHIRQRSKGSWEVAIDIGRDPSTGQRRQHFETVRGSKKDAERRLAELLIGIERGSYIRSPRTLISGEYLTEWLQSHAELHCRPRTAEGYRFIVTQYLSPALGEVRLSQLRPQHISNYCSYAVRRGLSNRTVLHHYRLLHKALKDGVKLGLIGINPCDGVDAPKPIDEEMKILSPDDARKFLSAAQKAPWPYYHLFYTMLFSGLRRSEALALTWGNLDLDLCTLRVTRTLHRISGGKYVIQPPKTRKSRRQLDLPASLALLLRDYRGEIETQQLLLGKPLTDDDFVFAHPDGTPLDPSTVTHQFGKVVRKAGLELRLHDLRHSFASIMLAAGVNVKAISQSLGHANIGVTLDIYAHLLPSAGKSAAERFDKLLKPWLVETGDVGNLLAKADSSDARLEGFEPTTLGSEDRCSVR